MYIAVTPQLRCVAAEKNSAFLKVVDALEIVHGSPLDPDLVGQHVTLLVVQGLYAGFGQKPEGTLVVADAGYPIQDEDRLLG